MTTIASSTSTQSSMMFPARPAAISIGALLCAIALPTLADRCRENHHRAPEVPVGLEVPAGNKVSFHTHAVGVQIYVATPSSADPTRLVWTFKAPEAVLFDDDEDVIGIHYAGPTWESENGGIVVGARVSGATVDATAIPWLLLQSTSTSGRGLITRTTYIQRVNTVGGLAPATPPTQAGQEVRVPYTADYYFFRESRH